jgi:hypothetical protein
VRSLQLTVALPEELLELLLELDTKLAEPAKECRKPWIIAAGFGYRAVCRISIRNLGLGQ